MDSIIGIIVIIVIVVLSMKGDKKKKPAQKTTQSIQRASGSVPKMSAKEAARVFMGDSLSDEEDDDEPDLVEPEVDIESDLVEPKVDIDVDLVDPRSESPIQSASLSPAQGESAQDANGCIGGSLGAHEEEGESHAEHARHLARADRDEESQAPATRRISRSDLRRAVITKEILDRPVSMRNRR